MSILPEFQQVNWELFFACDSLNANPFQANRFEYTTRFPHFFHGLGIFQNLRVLDWPQSFQTFTRFQFFNVRDQLRDPGAAVFCLTRIFRFSYFTHN